MAEIVREPYPLTPWPTGVPGLDPLLGGGLLRGGLYLVVGGPGTGKTILGNQVCFDHVARGGRAVYVTLLAELHGRMISHLESMDFFDPAPIHESLWYLSGYRALQEGGLPGLLDLLTGEVRHRRATLLVLDNFGTARAFAESPVAIKEFMNELHAHASLTGCTTLLFSDVADVGLAERIMVDGLLELSQRTVGQRGVREAQVLKMRGAGCLEGRHTLTLGTEGVRVYPRIEAGRGERPREARAPAPPVPTGTPGLDAMLGGGLAPGSITLLIGPPGSGKTSLCLQFLAEGARLGEAGLHFGLGELTERTVALGEGLGLGFRTMVEDGRVEMAWRAPVEVHLDALLQDLLDRVEARQVRRLVVDGLGGLRDSTVYPERVPFALVALCLDLRARGVTSVFTDVTPQVFGSTVDVGVLAGSAALDNMVVLRLAELGGRLRRLVSVVKVTQGRHDPSLRELLLDEHGIRVGGAVEWRDAGAHGPETRDRPTGDAVHRRRSGLAPREGRP